MGKPSRLERLQQKVQRTLRLDELSPPVRRLVVAVVGGTLLLVGLALIVLPGPAFIVIPLALLVLGTEFAWARSCVNKARNLVRRFSGSTRM